jgi:DNA-directed RNA polymerase specialized sigma subunit
MQHVLSAYFQKTRRYGLHASATKRKNEGLLPEAIKRNGHRIRTAIQIVTQLIKENPFSRELCESSEYDIIRYKQNKEWIHRFINIPTDRSPPKTKSHISPL